MTGLLLREALDRLRVRLNMYLVVHSIHSSVLMCFLQIYSAVNLLKANLLKFTPTLLKLVNI